MHVRGACDFTELSGCGIADLFARKNSRWPADKRRVTDSGMKKDGHDVVAVAAWLLGCWDHSSQLSREEPQLTPSLASVPDNETE